jgi:hypothetical protein
MILLAEHELYELNFAQNFWSICEAENYFFIGIFLAVDSVFYSRTHPGNGWEEVTTQHMLFLDLDMSIYIRSLSFYTHTH